MTAEMEMKGGKKKKSCPGLGGVKEYLVGGPTIARSWGWEKLPFQCEELG
jgi:hypothetical protein